MKHRMVRSIRLVALGIATVCALALNACGQVEDEMKLMERMTELEFLLNSTSIIERDEAEKELISLGPLALRHLSSPNDSMTIDLRARLVRVRLELEKQQVAALSRASRLTFHGELSLKQVLALIERQTANVVLPPTGPPEILESTLNVEWDDVEFWQALDDMQQQMGFAIDPLRGGSHRLQLAWQSARGGTEGKPEKADPPPVAYSGLMRIEVTRCDAVRHYRNPTANRLVCGLAVRWEPRLTPIAVEIPLDSIQVVDALDRTISLPGPGSLTGLVEQGISELEFGLPLPLMERHVETLRSISGKMVAVIAGSAETFAFPPIEHLEAGAKVQRADATVTVERLRKTDAYFELSLLLSYEEENNALESHRSWALNNEIYLRTEDGRRLEPIGMETYQQTNEGLGIRYLFMEAPPDAVLTYRSPAAVVKLELPFEIANVRLP